MASAFASIFAQQFSSFCLKKNIRLVSALPDALFAKGEDTSQPTYSFILDKSLLPACEDWIVRNQYYSIVFRHIAADHTSYWLHDVTQSEIIHIRFIHHICYGGITLLELNAIRQRAVFKQLFYHPDPVDQALILLLQYGFKEHNLFVLNKYAALLQTILAEHDTPVMEKMIDLFGSDQALDLERNIKRKADASLALSLSGSIFLYRAWTRIGGDLYQDMAVYLYHKLLCKMQNITVKIVLQGGSTERQTALESYLESEFGSLQKHIIITGKPVLPLAAKLRRYLVIPACLDRNSLQNAIASGFSRGLVLPHEISMERSQALLRNHVIARVDQYFSDNPV